MLPERISLMPNACHYRKECSLMCFSRRLKRHILGSLVCVVCGRWRNGLGIAILSWTSVIQSCLEQICNKCHHVTFVPDTMLVIEQGREGRKEGRERREGRGWERWRGGRRLSRRREGRGSRTSRIHQRISPLSPRDLRDDLPSVIKEWESENKGDKISTGYIKN